MNASNQKLTVTEIKICTLLKTGLTTKDIANVLFLSGRTVENHRYNIHRKLHLKNQKLLTFLMNI